MSTKAITIRLDEDTANQLQHFANSVSLSLGTFSKVVLKQAATSGSVKLERELRPTPYLEKRLEEVERDFKKNGHKNYVKINSIDELDKYLGL